MILLLIALFTIILIILITISIIYINNKNDNNDNNHHNKKLCKVINLRNLRKAKNRYYSYGKTLLLGGVIPSVKCAMNTNINSNLDLSSKNKAPIYKLTNNNNRLYFPFSYSWNGSVWSPFKEYVDWDSSSGLMCGNSWGKPSNMAKIFVHILSLIPDSKNTILNSMSNDERIDLIGNLYYKKIYDNKYDIPKFTDWQSNMKTQSTKCASSDIDKWFWGYGMIYVNGLMGYSNKDIGLTKNISNDEDEYIIWAHRGATYGYGCNNVFIPGSINNQIFGNSYFSNCDVAFNCSTNYDYADSIGDKVIKYILNKIFNNPDNYKLKEDVKNLLYEALNNVVLPNVAVTDYTCCFNVGFTPTISYFFINKSRESGYDWATISQQYDKEGSNTLINIYPDKLFPFKDGYLGSTIEPSYYFGSGTKPLTANLVINALHKKTKNRWKKVGDFTKWYLGTETTKNNNYNDSVKLNEIFNLKNLGNYYETIYDNKNNKYIKNKIQYLLKNCIYTKDACNYKSNVQIKCPFQLSDIAPKCTCDQIKQEDFSDIFLNKISIFGLASMQGGIVDADGLHYNLPKFKNIPTNINTFSPTSVDTLEQLYERTESIGSVNFIREAIGFQFYPGYNQNKLPNSPGLINPKIPAGMYSSSAYTLLGSFLWILEDSSTNKEWWEIDINEYYMPDNLKSIINFAGTSGNDGKKYMVNKGEILPEPKY